MYPPDFASFAQLLIGAPARPWSASFLIAIIASPLVSSCFDRLSPWTAHGMQHAAPSVRSVAWLVKSKGGYPGGLVSDCRSLSASRRFRLELSCGTDGHSKSSEGATSRSHVIHTANIDHYNNAKMTAQRVAACPQELGTVDSRGCLGWIPNAALSLVPNHEPTAVESPGGEARSQHWHAALATVTRASRSAINAALLPSLAFVDGEQRYIMIKPRR